VEVIDFVHPYNVQNKAKQKNSFEIFHEHTKLEFLSAVAAFTRIIESILNKTRKLMSVFVVQAIEAQ
jgi:hypothetical protein